MTKHRWGPIAACILLGAPVLAGREALIAQAQAEQALPQVVEAAIAENKKQCEEGKIALKPGFVSTKDINGDGKPDYVLNYGFFQCGEFETLLCGTGGCLNEVFASLDEGGYATAWNENARSIRFARVKGRPAMLLDLHGAVCGRNGNEPCAMTLYWNGEKFHPAN